MTTRLPSAPSTTRRATHAVTLARAIVMALALIAAIAAAPRTSLAIDDSYKGPPPTGGLDQQLRNQQRAYSEPPPGGAPRRRRWTGRRRSTRHAASGHDRADPDRHSRRSSATTHKLAADVAGVIAADLEGSGLFQPLDPASFLEQVRDVNAVPRFPDWRQIGADALAIGRV